MPYDKQQLRDLLNKIPVSGSYDAANYASKVSKLVKDGSFCSSIRTSGTNIINEDFSTPQALSLSCLAQIKHVQNAEARAALEDLTKAISELLPHLSQIQSTQIIRDLESLTEEAASPEPRKKWLQLSAQGVIDATKDIEQSAKTVSLNITRFLQSFGI